MYCKGSRDPREVSDLLYNLYKSTIVVPIRGLIGEEK